MTAPSASIPVSQPPDDTIDTPPADTAVSPAIGLDPASQPPDDTIGTPSADTVTTPQSPQATLPTLPTLPQAGGEPVFSHPDDQYLHYAGTVLDHATQYRDANGTLPAGQDLADIVGNAHAEAYGAGAAAAPQQAAAPAKADTPSVDGQGGVKPTDVGGIVKTNPYAGAKIAGAAAILGTAAEGMGTALAPEFVLPALGLGYAVSRLAQSGDGAPQQTTIADPNAGKPQVLPGSDPSQSQPQPGTPPSQPPQPLPPILPSVAQNPPSSTIPGSSAQPQATPEPLELKTLKPHEQLDHTKGAPLDPTTQAGLDKTIKDPELRSRVENEIIKSGTTTAVGDEGAVVDLDHGGIPAARQEFEAERQRAGIPESEVKDIKDGGKTFTDPRTGTSYTFRRSSTVEGRPTVDRFFRNEDGDRFHLKTRH